eukprot:NODE_553_length_1562_cov_124.819564_g402_i0.p1 GENE.NODE_553_length_1562_cov_124.819564_g402_i0~~NODE_553_length_1562_cov_124.819564_g402_i0.p1  ORF type:complete len:309 (-),score=43.25 NODE_553_length_1562_cov_124.819564_g402_i0:553-1479(-)
MTEKQQQQHRMMQDAKQFVGQDVEAFSSFDEMPLSTELLRGIYSYGFEKPSAIQERAIVPVIRGGDVVAQAQSGCGKTGAFSIGLLQRMDCTQDQVQGLVLAPTRELAFQTAEVITHLGAYLCASTLCATFVGGTPVGRDSELIRSGVKVAVGCPGRIFDLMRRGILKTTALKVMVLDEADEMLSEGFAEQVYEIFRFLPKDIQIALFSATLPDIVLKLSEKFLQDPVRILVKADALTLEGLSQFYVAVEEEYKFETLKDLYESVSVAQSIIFANSRRRVIWLADEMNKENFTVQPCMQTCLRLNVRR